MLNPKNLLTLAVLTLLPLAGCLGDGDNHEKPPTTPTRFILEPELREPLSEPVFEIAGHFEHTFTGTTGTQLYVDYYLPSVPAGELVPVILDFTPYQDPDGPQPPSESPVDPGVSGDPPHNRFLVEHFVPRGYAVAFADVRGNHNAGGCIDQTGPEQWQDGYDYVEWLGGQSWSNGHVGMYGASYEGETQLTTAMLNPPSLKTIVPVASVSNQYEWNFYQGVPYDLQPFIGMFAYLQGSLVPSSNPANAVYYPEKIECQAEAMGAGVDFSGDHTTFWKERDYRPMAHQINASVLHVHGLQDWNVRPIHIDPIFNEITSEKRGIFGQWRHAFPDREDWRVETLVAWYDHFLKGRQNGILDILPPVMIEDDEEQWWGIQDFPPRDQPWLTLELSHDNSLVKPGTAKEGQIILHDYPEDLLLGSASAPGATVGQSILGHPTTAQFSFTTQKEMRLVGRPWLEFTATSSAQSTHWVVELRVDGEDCALHGGGVTICQNAGYQDTRHRNGMDQPSDLTPGEPYRLNVTMYPQYDVIPAGRTVWLVVTNNSPDIQQDPTNSVNTLHLGGQNPALLHLPLAPTDAVLLPHDELPEIYPGYLP